MKYHSLLLLAQLFIYGHQIQLFAMLATMEFDSAQDVVSQLRKAALSGNHEVIKNIIDYAGSELIDERDVFSNSSLLISVKKGYQDCALTLIEHGANVRACNRKGRSVLDYAKKRGQLKVIDALVPSLDFDDVKILLDELAGKTVHSVMSSRLLWAFEAAKQNCRNVLIRLLDLGVNVNSGEAEGKTLLHVAAAFGSVPIYTLLLMKGAQEDQLDKTGKRAIDYGTSVFKKMVSLESVHKAIFNGNVPKLTEWMSHQPDTVKDVFSIVFEGMTVLHRAVLSGNEEMLPKVWKHLPRSLVDVTDQQGNTALILAAKKGFVAAMRLLVMPSDVAVRNTHGKDALFYALGHKNISMVDPFLHIVSQVDSERIFRHALSWMPTIFANVSPVETLWDLANRSHCLAFRRYLLGNKHMFYEIREQPGTTALHLACEDGIRVLVEMLLEEYDINAKDKKGRTALHISSKKGRNNVVGLLVKRGAELEAIDKKGRTPLNYAACKGFDEVARCLMKNVCAFKKRICGSVNESDLFLVPFERTICNVHISFIEDDFSRMGLTLYATKDSVFQVSNKILSSR